MILLTRFCVLVLPFAPCAICTSVHLLLLAFSIPRCWLHSPSSVFIDRSAISENDAVIKSGTKRDDKILDWLQRSSPDFRVTEFFLAGGWREAAFSWPGCWAGRRIPVLSVGSRVEHVGVSVSSGESAVARHRPAVTAAGGCHCCWQSCH